jgi:hypothetical protein
MIYNIITIEIANNIKPKTNLPRETFKTTSEWLTQPIWQSTNQPLILCENHLRFTKGAKDIRNK